MNKDLRRVLMVKDFPELNIRFISLSRYPDHDNQTHGVKGIVTIELAGITKRFDIDYKFLPDGPNSLILIGTRQVNFSDFNIIPPRKIGGMIRAKNELNIAFNLKVKILD